MGYKFNCPKCGIEVLILIYYEQGAACESCVGKYKVNPFDSKKVKGGKNGLLH